MRSILSDKFETEFYDSVKDIYLEALAQARRDMNITKEFLSLPETLKYLNISRNTLNKWLEKGLNIYRIENKQFIKKSEIHEFIEKHQI